MNIVLEPTYHPSNRMDFIFVLMQRDGQIQARAAQVEDTTQAEYKVLKLLQGTFHNDKDIRLCGWNSRYTFAKIMRRCMLQGVAFPWYYTDRFGPRYRYSVEHHLDVTDFMSEYGMYKNPSFAETATDMLGFDSVWLPAKDTYDGAVVAGILSVLLSAKCDLVRGALPRSTYNSMVSGLFANLNACLDKDMMRDRKDDALGVDYDLAVYQDVLNGYRAVINGFSTIPLLETV